MDEAIAHNLRTFKDVAHEVREEFPNPPKYMNVYKKL